MSILKNPRDFLKTGCKKVGSLHNALVTDILRQNTTAYFFEVRRENYPCRWITMDNEKVVVEFLVCRCYHICSR